MSEDIYTCTRCGEDFVDRSGSGRAICYRCAPNLSSRALDPAARRLPKEEWLDRLYALAETDKNAARLVAFFIALSGKFDPQVRTMMLATMLMISEQELHRCLDVLRDNGIVEERWMN